MTTIVKKKRRWFYFFIFLIECAVVKIEILYEGDLHTRLTHGPSGASIATDAPKDNMGKGEAFSPTDLAAGSLGACMLTVMGIVAKRRNIELKGSKVEVLKEMIQEPVRRIGKLTVTFNLPPGINKKERPVLERAAMTCPVHQSLHPSIEIPVKFNYPD